MIKIKIFDAGFIIKINNIEATTPIEILCYDKDTDIITKQLSDFGIKNFSITTAEKPNVLTPLPIQVPLMITPDTYKLNYFKDTVDERDHNFLKIDRDLINEAVKTEFIDYTSSMSPIKDQGKLGSCVGFAVTAMKEWQEEQEHLKEIMIGKQYDRAEKAYDLSEQWLYYKSKEIDDWPNEEGTSIRYALKILSKVGVPCEKAWPYNDIEVGKYASWATLISRWAIGGEYIRLNTPDDIIIALKNNGPVPIGIGCYQEIFYAKSDGIVAYPKNPNTCYGGHAVCLVGWNPTTGMFKFKNSWGLSWGEKGYGYLSYDYIKDFCWDAWMMKDLSVTKEMLKNSSI